MNIRITSLIFASLVVVASALLFSCKSDNSESFIDQKYFDQKPIAQIINLPDFSHVVQSFELKQDQAVKIYAVGEILYNLSESDKKYYLMGDDIKFFFRIQGISNDNVALRDYVFAYKDVKKFLKEGVTFSWKSERKNTSYVAEVQIPWKNLGVASLKDLEQLQFNIQVGDNDDGFIQDSEIAIASSQEYENLILSDSCETHGENSLLSFFGTPTIDGVIEESWGQSKLMRLEKVIRGYIKDSLDLSAAVRSQWDDQYIYFLIEVLDSRQKHIPPKKEVEREIFVDYGWIENENGELIWKMKAKESSYAGGMLKNQKIDTTLQLSAGKYILHYVTDESHSHKNWVGPPPSAPFYGIAVYSY